MLNLSLNRPNPMPQTYSAASIYGIIDRMDDTAIRAWLDWHKRLKHPPRFINVFTAARFNDAPNILRQVRDSLPDTTPVWRGYDGRDAWGNPSNPEWTDANYYINLWNHSAKTPAMAAGMWFARRVQPYLSLIRETNAIVHLLNEAAVVFNAALETEQIRLLGEEGIRAGAFAWSAGTPNWPDYQSQAVVDEIAMAAKYKTLVMCHEYAGIHQAEQNSLINRNTTLVKKFPADQQPDVFIGEFALAKASVNSSGGVDLDPDRGWREMSVGETQYLDFIRDTAKTWYVPDKKSFSIYSWPDWGKNGSFGVGKSPELLDRLVDASEWMCFTVEDAMPEVIEPVIVVRPPEARIGLLARIKFIPAEFRNLRADHNYAAAKTGEVKAGDVVRRFDIPAYDGQVSAVSMGKWVFAELLDGNTVTASGWIWRDRIVWDTASVPKSTQEITAVGAPIIPTPAPVPVEESPVLPPPPQETWPEPAPTVATVTTVEPPVAPVRTWLRYGFEIETTPEKHAVIEQAMMAMLLCLATFGQAIAGEQVKITTDAVA